MMWYAVAVAWIAWDVATKPKPQATHPERFWAFMDWADQ